MRAPASSRITTLACKTDDWFQRASAALLSQIPCHSGCCRCCIGLFPITRLDRRLLQDGLAHLSTAQREPIIARAAQQVTALEAAFPRLSSSPSLDAWSDADIDEAVRTFRHAPCPALGDSGECSLYDSRPLTCRSMGIPTREGALVQGACDVQTFIPITRLSASLEAEEQVLANLESAELAALPEVCVEGEEVLLPYGFVSISQHQ
jgi:Fe-S-cluster containining protein